MVLNELDSGTTFCSATMSRSRRCMPEPIITAVVVGVACNSTFDSFEHFCACVRVLYTLHTTFHTTGAKRQAKVTTKPTTKPMESMLEKLTEEGPLFFFDRPRRHIHTNSLGAPTAATMPYNTVSNHTTSWLACTQGHKKKN